MAFRGNFEHSIDERGRVAIPSKYRDEFPKDRTVIIPAPEGCLRVFPEAAFQLMSDENAAVPATTPEGRRLRRLFDGRSYDVELDRQGRILIPAQLRQRAGLNGAVVIAGAREYLEIWSPEVYEKEMQEAELASSAGQRPEE